MGISHVITKSPWIFKTHIVYQTLPHFYLFRNLIGTRTNISRKFVESRGYSNFVKGRALDVIRKHSIPRRGMRYPLRVGLPRQRSSLVKTKSLAKNQILYFCHTSSIGEKLGERM